MSDPLTRYRRGASHLATKLSSSVFDEGDADEIDDLWATEVAPVLLELEARYAEHRLVREIARSLSADLHTFVLEGAALWMGIDKLTSVHAWIASSIAVAEPGAHAENDVFFLYDADRRFG